ncbi:hypothetical protein C5E06_10825 [Pseudoclavibacter sp. RFBI5]|uniref:hypothetical protein n=1 Tax=Pseudoclavibacter sp. RFBI5 TaxID=2080578 RepID=UPI000CE76E93|nr:hypothetical protein [Pseudoclavibacter sp. RFBI5]PPG02920.1 hypothetical protein C5E06_10825 [Pseudoclavibacter sp. RFBI5]
MTPTSTLTSAVDKNLITTSALHAGACAVAALFSGAGLSSALALLLSDLAPGSQPSPSNAASGFELLWQVVLLLTALPFSGQLRLGVESVGGFSLTGDSGLTLGLWPLASLAFVLAVSLATAYGLERRGADRGRRGRLGAAAVSSGTFAVLLLCVAAPGLRLDTPGAAATVTALSPALAPVAFTSIFLSGWLGRSLAARGRPGRAPQTPLPGSRSRELRLLVAELGIYTATLAVAGSLLGIIAMILGVAQSESPLTSVPVLLAAAPHLALTTLILGHLGAIAVSFPFGPSTVASVFSPELPYAWLALLPVVAATVASAVLIGVGRPETRFPQWSSLWRLPAAALLVWTILTSMLLPVVLTGSASALGFSLGDLTISVRPSFWTPALFAIWALAVELLAWALPPRLRIIAPRLHSRAVSLLARLDRGRAPAADGSETRPPLIAQPAASTPPAWTARQLGAPARRRLRRAGAALAIAAIIIAATATAVTALNGHRGAIAEARRYVQAIADGNASLAGELVDPNIESAQRQYVSDEMLAAATERITVLDIVELEAATTPAADGWLTPSTPAAVGSGRETKNVQVTYRLGGTTETAVLVAERVDNEFLVLEHWRILTPLVFASAVGTSHAMDLTIGAVTVTPDPVDSRTWEGSQPVSWVQFDAYPAIYPVTGTISEFYSTSNQPVRVGTIADDHVATRNVVYTPTEALQSAVQSAVTAKIDECASSTAAAPVGCPFSTYASGANRSVNWSIATYPTVTVSDTSDSFEIEGGLATYISAGESGRTTKGSDTIWEQGTFTIDGEKVTVEFR